MRIWWGLLALALGSAVPLAGVGSAAGQAGQGNGRNGPKEPSVFRAVARDGPFPELRLLDLAGQEVTLAPAAETPSVLAFLRADQEDSHRLLDDLERLALDDGAPAARFVVVGMRASQRATWAERLRVLPRRITFLFDGVDGGTTSERLGVIVLPSVALLSAEGNLHRAHVLYDPQLLQIVRSELELLAAGGGGAAGDAAQRRARRIEELRLNAAALERAYKYQDSLALRQRVIALGAEPARAHADLGHTYYHLGQAGAAVKELERSLELQETVSARTWLGRALARDGRDQDAERVLLAVLSHTPERAVVQRELAEIYERRGDLDRALEHVKAAIDELRKAPPAPASDEPVPPPKADEGHGGEREQGAGAGGGEGGDDGR